MLRVAWISKPPRPEPLPAAPHQSGQASGAPHLCYLLLHRAAGGDLALFTMSSNPKKPRPSFRLGPGLTASGMRCMSDGSDADILTAAA
jgi:hypothetical protein